MEILTTRNLSEACLSGMCRKFARAGEMIDDQGRTVRFEPIEGDDDRILMIETLDLRHPCCPVVVIPSLDLLCGPSDDGVRAGVADAIARFERAGGVILRDGTVTLPEAAPAFREIYTRRDRR
jgi:hypothetical protein